MATLPQDSAMLLSFINTKLRDEYPSFFTLCDDLDVSQEEISRKLNDIGYEYDEQLNKFI